MNIAKFDKSLIENYDLFYRLKKFNIHNKPKGLKILWVSGDIEYEQHKSPLFEGLAWQAFEMADGSIVFAFSQKLSVGIHNNLWAYNDTTLEPVPTKPFEKFEKYYDKPTTNSIGFFCFHDSIVIGNEGDQSWRCDNIKYGPRPFNDGQVTNKPILSSLDDIPVYEQILSASSIGHLLYVEIRIDSDKEDYFLNRAIIPAWTRTMFEALKLVWEWSKTVDSPWNCTDPIAIKAKQFIDVHGLNTPDWDKHFSEHQVPMQVANYLTGEENARQRPIDVAPMTDKVDRFIRESSAYTNFDDLVKLFPTII